MTTVRCILCTSIAVATLAGCGGGSDSSAPPSLLQAPLPSAAEIAAASAVIGLLRIPSHYLDAAAATTDRLFFEVGDKNTPNACSLFGSYEMTIDGSPASLPIPGGKHSLTGQFRECTFAGPMQDIILEGAVDLNYEGIEPMNVAGSIVMKDFGYSGEYKANGAAEFKRQRDGRQSESHVTLPPGSSITSMQTTNRAEFHGGKFTSLYATGPQGSSGDTYEDVILEFNGVRYRINGRMEFTNERTCSGEVRVVDGNGELVARRYCSALGDAAYELLRPIPSF